MQSSSEDQPSLEDTSPGSEKGNPAGWNDPKPSIIPSPTYWPFILSVGATLMGLGVLTSNVITVAGSVLFVVAIIKWIGELSSED